MSLNVEEGFRIGGNVVRAIPDELPYINGQMFRAIITGRWLLW